MTKGLAGYLMILAHIAGGRLYFGTFGAALFYTCSGMNTILFLKKTAGNRLFNYYHLFFSIMLFFGGYTQIKAAHPYINKIIPEFLQLAALSIFLIWILNMGIKNHRFIGYLFPLPFILYSLYKLNLFSLPQIPFIGFLVSHSGFSICPWTGYYLFGIFLIQHQHRNFYYYTLLITGFLGVVFGLFLKIPLQKFYMSLTYMAVSLFFMTLLFFIFKLLSTNYQTKGYPPVLQFFILVGRNSLMFVYIHYLVIRHFRLGKLYMPLFLSLLIKTLFLFLLTCIILYFYEKIKNHYYLFLPATLLLAILILNSILSFLPWEPGGSLQKIIIGILFAFLYVQLRGFIKLKIRKPDSIKSPKK